MTGIEKSIALGVPVFKRTEALKRCLESVDATAVDRVIVADNGRVGTHDQVYEQDWEFELTVLDLEYNSGIGACRAAIADELTEEYLIVGDNDMIIPPASELRHLQTALEYDTNLGAVSGIIVEGNRVRSGCSNLHEETSLLGGKLVVHAIRSDPTVEWVRPTLPIARFDKLTDATMIRRGCIDDYSWDARFPIREHLDFYLGQYHRTDWEFAVCPAVIFDHQKGRYPSYRRTVRTDGQDYRDKRQRTEELYRQKWGYDRIEYGYRPDWIDTESNSFPEQAFRLSCRYVPIRYTLPFKEAVTTIRDRI